MASDRSDMETLSKQFLKLLKCCHCDGHLSMPPIMKYTVGSFCGNCVKQSMPDTGEIGMRNTEYEILAELFMFPCRYKGCDRELPFGAIGSHEMDCQFRTYICPIGQRKCWFGKHNILQNHLRKHHKDILIASNIIEVEFAKDNTKMGILINDDDYFIVKWKVDLSQDKFWCVIRYIGSPAESGYFKYVLHMVGNKFGKTHDSPEKTVQAETTNKFDTKSTYEIKISVLLSILKRPNNIKCMITLYNEKDEDCTSDSYSDYSSDD